METRPDPAGGTLVTLRAQGAARFLGAGFLAVWLCGWAVGETFALVLLAGMAWRAAGGAPFPEGDLPAGGAGLAMAAFLLVWLTFWTFGGVMAIRQLLELLVGREEVSFGPSGLRVRRHAGPLRSRREVPAGAAVRFALRRKDGALVAETGGGSVVVARFGSREDRAELLERLRHAFRGAPDPALAPAPGTSALPPSWKEETGLDAVPVLVPDQRWRGVAGALLAVVAALLVVAAVAGGRPGGPGAGGAVVSGALGLAAWALALAVVTGRTEWGLGPGRLERRTRRFGRLTPRFEGNRLRVETRVDEDGDESARLVAVRDADGAGRTVLAGERGVLRRLGTWIAERTGVPFEP